MADVERQARYLDDLRIKEERAAQVIDELRTLKN